MRKPKFEIFRTKNGDYFWHLKAGNGKIRCQGEPHPTYNNVVRAIRGVVTSLGGDPDAVTIVDLCGGT